MINLQKRIVKLDFPFCTLLTAIGEVNIPKGTQWKETILLFDSESQCSLITRELAEKLNFKFIKELTFGADAFVAETKKRSSHVTNVILKLESIRIRIKLLVISNASISIHTPGTKRVAKKLQSAGYQQANKYILNSDIIDDIGIVISALQFSF